MQKGLIMNIAISGFAELKRILKAPTHSQIVWQEMNNAEKRTILKHSGFVDEIGRVNSPKDWNSYNAASRKKIMDSIIRASKWASQLGQVG